MSTTPGPNLPLLIGGLLLALASGSAHALEFGMDLGSTGHHLKHRSSYPLTQDQQLDTFSLRLGVGVRPDVHAEVEWRSGEQVAQRLHSLRTVLESDAWLGGARFQRRPLPWLEPFVRGAAGVTRTRLDVSQFPTYSSRTWAPLLAGGVGVDIVIPREVFRRSAAARVSGFTLGLTVELGWQHAFGQSLLLKGDRNVKTTDSDPPQEILQEELDLGTLTLTGWTTRIALVVRL